MADKSIAELLHLAYLTGNEATFTVGGETYTFTPSGILSFINEQNSMTDILATLDDFEDRITALEPQG